MVNMPNRWRTFSRCAVVVLGVGAGVAVYAQPALGLQEAFRMALENDANLRASRWQEASVAERVTQAEAQLKPNLSLSVGRYYNDLDRTQPNLLGADTTTNDQYFGYNQTLQLRQPLYRPGLLKGVRVAEAQLADARALKDREAQSTATKVVEAYLLSLQAQESEGLLQSQLAMANRQLDAARKRFEGGQGVRTDADELLARIDLIEAQKLEAAQTRQTALLQLRLLTQSQVHSVRSLDVANLELTSVKPESVQELVKKAFDNSPEIKSFQARLDAAREEVGRAQAGHRPTLDALLQVSRSGSENVTSPRSSYINRQVGLQLNVPLYAGGAVQSAVRQALAEQSRAEEALQAAQRDLEVRIQREWRASVEGVKKALALDKAVQSASLMVTSVSRSFEGGVRTVLDVLNAEERKLQAMKEFKDACLGLVAARLRLSALVGELDETRMRHADAWFPSGR